PRAPVFRQTAPSSSQFFHPHERRHFGAKRRLVELEGLLATAVEEQVELDLQASPSWTCIGFSFSDVEGPCIDNREGRHEFLSNGDQRNRQAVTFFYPGASQRCGRPIRLCRMLPRGPPGRRDRRGDVLPW